MRSWMGDEDDEWAAGRRPADGADDDLLHDGEQVAGADAELEPQRQQMQDGIPICGHCGGEPIPDLNALAQERWLEVLRPLSPSTRREATSRLHTVAQAHAALEIRGRLWLEDAATKAHAEDAPPPQMPAGAPPARGASQQINFRLGPNEHARLVAASKLFAMRPTTLARVLTMRGVERALYEERRDR